MLLWLFQGNCMAPVRMSVYNFEKKNGALDAYTEISCHLVAQIDDLMRWNIFSSNCFIFI